MFKVLEIVLPLAFDAVCLLTKYKQTSEAFTEQKNLN